MLERTHRFHGYGSLRYVYQHGERNRSSLLGLRLCQNPRRRQYRLAVVVSKKVHKSAVVRNRIRRRLYALCRQQLSGVQGGYDIVLTVFQDKVATMPPAELQKELQDLLGRGHLVKPPATPRQRDIIETKET